MVIQRTDSRNHYVELRHGRKNSASCDKEQFDCPGVVEYKESFQEKAQRFMEGSMGLALEILNIIFSTIIFTLYVIELYDGRFNSLDVTRAVELIVTVFFVIDLVIHLVVATHPLRYLTSVSGAIDLLTVIPSVVILFIKPQTDSQVLFILRLGRTFKAMRVLRLLRLKQFLKFHRRGFEYELTAFTLSSIAAILCAAGVYHAFEAPTRLRPHIPPFEFHAALYFILVTISTVGFGDISPKTTIGQVFVILIIIGVFTVVPSKVKKLNELAKLDHAYDKAYIPGHHQSSGHVIVYGYEFTAAVVTDFLQEFYHPSRGEVCLDVVFMCPAIPTPELLRSLRNDKYRRQTPYLRGSLTCGKDQDRARLTSATGVFFLASRKRRQLSRQEALREDAMTILNTLSIRNVADSIGRHIHIYVQLISQDELAQSETASFLLGAVVTTASQLKNMILARAAVCPGAGTFILNLTYSVRTEDYAKLKLCDKLWVSEYLDGINYQIFPLVFTDRFENQSYAEIAKNIYERFGSILVAVRKRNTYSQSGNIHTPLKLAPFEYIIEAGDIGFLIARSSAVVLCISQSYGVWESNTCGRKTQSKISPPKDKVIRISVDNLLRRHTRYQQCKDAPYNKSYSSKSVNLQSECSINSMSWSLGSCCEDDSAKKFGSILLNSEPQHNIDGGDFEDNQIDADYFVDNSKMEESCRKRHQKYRKVISTCNDMNMDDFQIQLQQYHFKDSIERISNHYIICGGQYQDNLFVISLLRRFHRLERRSTGTQHSQLNSLKFVMLVDKFPTASELVDSLNSSKHFMQSSTPSKLCYYSQFFNDIYFIVGCAAKSLDLQRAASESAYRIIILPLRGAMPASISKERNDKGEEGLADFGTICALLALEMNDQKYLTSHIQPNKESLSFAANHMDSSVPLAKMLRCRNRLRSRGNICQLLRHDEHEAFALYRREIQSGLPIECVKLRMLERFPQLDTDVFHERDEIIDYTIERFQQNEHEATVSRQAFHGHEVNISDRTIAALHYARNAQFCRPRDGGVQREFPYITPSFASGNLFLSSILDRIICHTFYNPYFSDLIELMALGDSGSNSNSTMSFSSRTNEVHHMYDSPRTTTSSQTATPHCNTEPEGQEQIYRRLYVIDLEEHHVSGRFYDIFLNLLNRGIVVVAILRSPNPLLENLRKYVYTCPSSDTTVYAHDRLLVLG